MRIPGLSTMVQWITDTVRTEVADAMEAGMRLGVTDVFERYAERPLGIEVVDEPQVTVVPKVKPTTGKVVKKKTAGKKRGTAKA